MCIIFIRVFILAITFSSVQWVPISFKNKCHHNLLSPLQLTGPWWQSHGPWRQFLGWWQIHCLWQQIQAVSLVCTHLGVWFGSARTLVLVMSLLQVIQTTPSLGMLRVWKYPCLIDGLLSWNESWQRLQWQVSAQPLHTAVFKVSLLMFLFLLYSFTLL